MSLKRKSKSIIRRMTQAYDFKIDDNTKLLLFYHSFPQNTMQKQRCFHIKYMVY